MARNTKGQITSTRTLEFKISKQLQDIADDVAIRVKPLVRDELEQTLRAEIYASYTPATKAGKETQKYNETHKHQKASAYHHTGTLASSIYGYINGNIVGAKPREGVKYEDGTPVEDVYNYLKFGTTTLPKKKSFSYDDNKNFSAYISQEPHNFEARTREHMKQYLDDLIVKIQRRPQDYSEKYTNAVKKKFFKSN